MSDSPPFDADWHDSEPQPPDLPTPQPRPFNMPTEIGGYRIQRVLGSGGMATVYAAMQKQPRRVVALKVMKHGISLARGDAAHRRFQREIEILGKLRHPYIAQVYGAGIHDDDDGASGGMPYFVMEYVPGAKSITEYVAARQLDTRDRLKLFVKVCAAMEHGHRHKTIHRDLKPANILIDENGDPKIIDFGVAQAAEVDLSQTMHTEAGRMIGTLQYMSPEQLDSRLQDLDARCDVYALGVLLYKLLTGKPPHDLESLPVFEAVRVIREQSPRSPSALRPDLRGDLETIILKAMDPDRTRRYRNAGSLGRDIVRFLANKPINARRAGLGYRAGLFVRRHRTALTSGGIVGFIMSAALAFVLFDRLTSPKTTTPPATGARSDDHSTNNSVASITPAPPPKGTAQPFVLRRHTGTITALAFAPDGTFLVSAAYDRSLALWDLQTRRSSHSLANLNAAVKHLCFNHDGSLLAAAGDRGGVTILRVPLLERLATINLRDDAVVSAIALDPNGDRLAIALNDLTLRLVSLGDPRLRVMNLDAALTLRSATGVFTCLAFSTDGRDLAAGSQGGAVYVWNADDGGSAIRFHDARDEIVAIAMGDRLIGVAANAVAYSWVVPENRHEAEKQAESFIAAPGSMSHVSFDATGTWLSCAAANEISVWSFAEGAARRITPSLQSADPAHALAITPAEPWCAIGHANGDILLLPFTIQGE